MAVSIKQGTVTASLMLRKRGSYPRQNGLAVSLRELGHIERTLFILNWQGMSGSEFLSERAGNAYRPVRPCADVVQAAARRRRRCAPAFPYRA